MIASVIVMVRVEAVMVEAMSVVSQKYGGTQANILRCSATDTVTCYMFGARLHSATLQSVV